MDEMQMFDPLKELSSRVRSELEGAPPLDLDEALLPQAGEKITIWYLPLDYAEFKRLGSHPRSETVEIIRWYHSGGPNGRGPIVALICRESPRGNVAVLCGDDWTIKPDVVFQAAAKLCEDQHVKFMDQAAEVARLAGRLARQAEDLKEERQQAEAELLANTASVMISLPPGALSSQTRQVVEYVKLWGHTRLARKRTDTRRLRLVEGGKEQAAGVLLVEAPAEPLLHPQQVELGQSFLTRELPVWVWRDGWGVQVESFVDGYASLE